DRNGNIINEPYNLRDVSETIAVPDNSGNVHITYCSISSSLAYSLWERGLFKPLPKPLEPVGGIEMFMPNEIASETWSFTTVSGGTPVASFTVNPCSGATSTVFNFDATGSFDAEDSLDQLQIRWDWQSDGTWTDWTSGKTSTHQYSSPAYYNVKLEVKDTENASSTAVKTIQVNSAPPPPVPGDQAIGPLWVFITRSDSGHEPVAGQTWSFTTKKILAADLSVSQENYCKKSYPPIFLSWTFSDQSAYQVQVDNNSDFSSPEKDSCLPSPGTCENNSSNVYAPANLSYNTTYNWRLKVWDSQSNKSDWIDGQEFTTEKHQYPTVDFTWFPANPSLNENISFKQESVVYDGAGEPSWSWTFQNGNPANSSSSSLIVQFVSTGSKQASLTVTDSDNYTCSASKLIGVQSSLPSWREVAP
ncbi:hypothetical protein KJ743_03185, partial [Patescibacteria group bacterium]|nr:hypothetical protein [Patescibacteria group bacterium]